MISELQRIREIPIILLLPKACAKKMAKCGKFTNERTYPFTKCIWKRPLNEKLWCAGKKAQKL